MTLYLAIKFYAYPKCSTCKKAQSLLNRKKRAYEAIDITATPPDRGELKAMLAHVGGDMRRLFNTSGLVYKEMGLSKKLAALSESDALKLLASNGKLIRRPFLIVDGKPAAIGFSEQEWDLLV